LTPFPLFAATLPHYIFPLRFTQPRNLAELHINVSDPTLDHSPVPTCKLPHFRFSIDFRVVAQLCANSPVLLYTVKLQLIQLDVDLLFTHAELHANSFRAVPTFFVLITNRKKSVFIFKDEIVLLLFRCAYCITCISNYLL